MLAGRNAWPTRVALYLVAAVVVLAAAGAGAVAFWRKQNKVIIKQLALN